MQTVLFLDVDGVLNTVPPAEPIEPDKVRLLARLVHATGASIVLHSGWRFWFDDALRPLRAESAHMADLLAAEGLTLAGRTPDLSTGEIRRTRRFSQVKAEEILAWLAQHPAVQRWCVLDDLDLHNDAVAAHQVRPDAGVGLTHGDTLAAQCIPQGG